MKIYFLIFSLITVLNARAQDAVPTQLNTQKDTNGILLSAPKGVHQYEFRIGEWESTFKSLKRNGEWKTGTSYYKVYVADNGLSFIEEGFDEGGRMTHTISFDYIEDTDSWQNHYVDLNTGKVVEYTSKIIGGNMVETIVRENSTNNNTYTIVDNNVYIYTAKRDFQNGFSLVNHIGISTKNITTN